MRAKDEPRLACVVKLIRMRVTLALEQSGAGLRNKSTPMADGIKTRFNLDLLVLSILQMKKV